ncbi:MAG: TIGR02391 family protein [Spirochaetia bacterium]|nr:TIGR02391 family protein [Spirochaetia bacterium]
MSDKKRHFTAGQIEKISKIIGETYSGLTGTEIEYFLSSIGLQDVDPELTKWKRLYNAFVKAHNEKIADNFILSFISIVFQPSRFIGDSKRYNFLLDELNTVLSFIGLRFQEDGKFHTVKESKTLSEAEKRAINLKKSVIERGFHTELLKYCEAELLEDNYFHAVLEAIKGIASMIRSKTNLTIDGVPLIEKAFSGKSPLLYINNFQNESEISEQKGFVNLLKGLFGTFRNPTAHAAKIEWIMEKQDALDLFAIASYSYRRIEHSNKKR